MWIWEDNLKAYQEGLSITLSFGIQWWNPFQPVGKVSCPNSWQEGVLCEFHRWSHLLDSPICYFIWRMRHLKPTRILNPRLRHSTRSQWSSVSALIEVENIWMANLVNTSRPKEPSRNLPHMTPPEYNSVAEHLNCTLLEHTCTMLHASKLPRNLLEQAVTHAGAVQDGSCRLSIMFTPPLRLYLYMWLNWRSPYLCTATWSLQASFAGSCAPLPVKHGPLRWEVYPSTGPPVIFACLYVKAGRWLGAKSGWSSIFDFEKCGVHAGRWSWKTVWWEWYTSLSHAHSRLSYSPRLLE